MIPDPILTSMASSLAMSVAHVVAAEISKQRAVKDDVSKLNKNYERVALMIKSAERRAIVDDDMAKYWMKRVKDHMYEVENVIDHWVIKNEKRRQRDAECELGSIKYSIGCCMDYSLTRFADAIKTLNEDFECILKLPTEAKRDQQTIRSYGKTTPDYNADIVGDYVRSNADNIIKLLHESNCRLIAIVGMVGIGKTTLARMIYHTVKTGTSDSQHFDTKLWIRFSSDLSSMIMWSDRRKEGLVKAQLLQLGTEIANKKFLLVVDSVWTENIWEALLEGPLQQGKRESSRVIVTTRNKQVARKIGAGHIHHVKRMNNSDAWRLLCKRASLSQIDEADLKDIGQQIVEKCDGLPFAIRSIGRTLRGLEPTRHDWENACRTAFLELSSEEQYIINLSFQDLSSVMRQCFLYCSVFPEGFFVEKQYIIQHWISEGFILKKRQSTLEDIAEYYFHELIARGLLHLVFGSNGVTGAKMPIILHSFAKDVSDHENFCNETMSTANHFEARRLSIVDNNGANNYISDDGQSGVINGDSAKVFKTIVWQVTAEITMGAQQR
ncbi:hypothetical protein ACP70R_039269 [Stipagrostis hirtigluma subsp. patula]